jgi:hypothetical protein
MANTTDECLAEDAASYIGRNTDAVQCLDGSSKEIDRQSGLLVAWALKTKSILPLTYFSGLRQLGNITAEHVVYFRECDNRAIKQTHAGTFGVTPDIKGKQKEATPLSLTTTILHLPVASRRIVTKTSIAVNRLFLLLTNDCRLRGRPRGGERSKP